MQSRKRWNYPLGEGGKKKSIAVYLSVLPLYLSAQINSSEIVEQISLFLHYHPENSIFCDEKKL